MEQKVCEACGFGVWHPVADLSRSRLGIYNDARFRGRCILTLDTHFDNIEDVDVSTLASFMEDIQHSVRAIKKATGSMRVNVAILGNAESHVHAHLIPRYPSNEEFPNSSPWNDKRPRSELGAGSMKLLTDEILDALHIV